MTIEVRILEMEVEIKSPSVPVSGTCNLIVHKKHDSDLLQVTTKSKFGPEIFDFKFSLGWSLAWKLVFLKMGDIYPKVDFNLRSIIKKRRNDGKSYFEFDLIHGLSDKHYPARIFVIDFKNALLAFKEMEVYEPEVEF